MTDKEDVTKNLDKEPLDDEALEKYDKHVNFVY